MVKALFAVCALLAILPVSGTNEQKLPFDKSQGYGAFSDIPDTVNRQMGTLYAYIDWKVVAARLAKLSHIEQTSAALVCQDFPIEYVFATDVFSELRGKNFLPPDFNDLALRGSPTVIVEFTYCKDQIPLGLGNGKKCAVGAGAKWMDDVDGTVIEVVDTELRSSQVRVSILADATDKKGKSYKVIRYRQYEFQRYDGRKPNVSHGWKLLAHAGHAWKVVPKDAHGIYVMTPPLEITEQ